MRVVAIFVVTAVLMAVGVIAVARQGGDDGQAVTINAEPVRMIALPRAVKAACVEFALVKSCPARLPYVSGDSHWRTSGCRPGAAGCGGVSWFELHLEHIERYADVPPPRWVHAAVIGGELDRTFPFPYPVADQSDATPLADGLFRSPRENALYFGEVTWGGRRGSLVLAPSHPAGGPHGDHLIFRWRDESGDHAVGLHGWEPLTQAAATLRNMIDS